jgi:hypothetical protein
MTMLPTQYLSTATAPASLTTQNTDMSPSAPAHADPVTSALDALIGNKFVLVFIGFSGQGYQDPTRLDDTLTHIMQQTIDAHGEANVVVVAGATKDGIGRCYELAKQTFNLQTIGIVSELGAAYASPQCDAVVYVEDPDKSWRVRTPDNKTSYMVSVAQRRGEIYALGGGAVAIEELGEAIGREIPCQIFDDFMPNRPSDPAHPSNLASKQPSRIAGRDE